MFWQQRAACRDEDPELFFPIGETTAADIQQIEVAKSVCRSCPVQAECREFVMDARMEHGVWAATTDEERRTIKRRESRRRSRPLVEAQV